jgi:hypothetical protein
MVVYNHDYTFDEHRIDSRLMVAMDELATGKQLQGA